MYCLMVKTPIFLDSDNLDACRDMDILDFGHLRMLNVRQPPRVTTRFGKCDDQLTDPFCDPSKLDSQVFFFVYGYAGFFIILEKEKE